MNILVTGGAGYIGSGLLLKLGEEFPEATITSMDNLTTGDYRHIEHLKKDKRYRLLIGDIRKKSDTKRAIAQDTSMIIHLAAMPGVKSCNDQPKEAIETNIYGTHLLLEEAVNHNVKKFVFTSSAAVYGTPEEHPIRERHPLKPINLYGVTKVSGEKLVNGHHITSGL
ncbi:MAG: GDP-mannose 4,6-dehydratase, partial [Candidatus Bathyarchaeota archaeon]|nr:GDP-mannose 4,6-dehydratase [Candidatus Bathyarchaeota archaeon]